MKLESERWKEVCSSKTRALAMEAVLLTSSFVGTISVILPHEIDDNGHPIPTLIFGGLAGAFHSFIVCVIFAFTFSLSALLTPNKSFTSKLFYYFALISTASATAILVLAASSGGHGDSLLSAEI